MGLTVEELLKIEQGGTISLISGEKGIKNEIKGVTIIEAPDIVKFINGGELLLTGLYAFQTCSVSEFKKYIYELRKKQISGLIIKRGRQIADVEAKINLLKEFSESYAVPLMEIPFKLSFQTILSLVMERLFNEEVTRLKYDKTTRDNFSALTLTGNAKKDQIPDILDMLDKLIDNPVALFNQNMTCYAASRSDDLSFRLSKSARKYNPGILSHYKYMRQKEQYTQYIVPLHFNIGINMYLVITETTSVFNQMDCIAVENAIIALQYEFSRKFAISELEKKFQNDILHNILRGKVMSAEELKESTALLGMNIEGYYRTVVFGVADESKTRRNINERLHHTEILEEVVREVIPECKIHREVERIVVVEEASLDAPQNVHRKEMYCALKTIQKTVKQKNKYLCVKAGIGKIVKGLLHLPETYREANDAYLFVDIIGDTVGDDGARILLFSDLGVFKLLCRLDSQQLMEYIPESLQKLLDYKKPQQEDLLITLQTYLDRNQNLTKTAQDLFVHYKTAAYRVNKITKVTGIDFDNANEVLSVRIGLVVYRMIKNSTDLL